MDKKNIVKKFLKEDKKSIHIGMRISPRMSKWLKENNYSPTRILYEAFKDLGYKQEK